MRIGPVLRVLGAIIIAAVGGCAGVSTKDAKDAQAHFKLGMSSLNRGELQPAKVEFEKAVELNPRDRDAHYALGHIYYVWNKLAEAEREFKRTLSIDSDFSAAQNYLGKVYEQRKEWDQAIRAYRRALENKKYETPQYAHFNLGIALKHTNRMAEALLEFQEALQVDPNFVVGDAPAAYSVHNEIGQMLAGLGRLDEAIGAYQKALALAPNYPEAHFNLGLAYYNGGARDKAKEEFRQVIRLAPEAEVARNSKQYLDLLN
jgi:tetratricopeptide (TPR) repeat protein